MYQLALYTSLDCSCAAAGDERDLIQRARDGDAEAFGTLLRTYRPRIFAQARRYFAPGSDRDDLIQEAMIGFFKAIRDFADDRSSFASFTELCVRRQIITFIKTATRQKHAALNHAISLDTPLSDDSSDTLLSRLVAEGLPSSEDTADVEFLDMLWTRCSDLERRILSLYARGYSFAEMAFELGVHWKSVDNGIWRVKVKARKLLAEKVSLAWRSLAVVERSLSRNGSERSRTD